MKKRNVFSAWLNMAIMVLCLAATTLNAQIGLFTEITVNPDTLGAESQVKHNKLQQDPTVTEIRFVEFADLSSVQVNGRLNLTIPGTGCTATVKAKQVESSANGDFYWYGEVQSNGQDTTCCDGYINLMSKGGKLFGSIHIDEDIYQLYGLDGDKSILAKKDYTNPQWICGNNLPGDASSILPPGEAIVTPRNNNCVIRVLALFWAIRMPDQPVTIRDHSNMPI